MWYLIIIIPLVLFSLIKLNNQNHKMSSTYNGLLYKIRYWNDSFVVVHDDYHLLIIRSRKMRADGIEGESTFTFSEKSDGNLKITFETEGYNYAFGNININLVLPQSICINDYVLVWEGIIEKINNAVLENTQKHVADLIDGFYGIK
jgi:hypothetical protein